MVENTTDTENQETNLGPTVTLEEGGLYIDFSTYWKRDLSEFSFFSMTRKRNFSNMADRCGAALSTLLQDEDFNFALMNLRFALTLPEGDESFIERDKLADEIAILFNDNVVSIIGNVVDTAYESEGVDINTDHNGKNNEELQFTNDHAKIILRWSFACIAAAPIITAYMNERLIQQRESLDLIVSVFCTLLKKFEPADGSVDIQAKIRKLTESRVFQTRYSDKVIWSYLRNIATDPTILIERLFRKFIIEGIPKVNQGTNIIKFFHTFLKKQINFQFTAKFPISYKSVRKETNDPESAGAMDHLESELVRRDEGAQVLGEITCEYAIAQIFHELGWEPSKEEQQYWQQKLLQHGINAWQRGLVTKFFLPRIGRVELIQTRSLPEYTMMFLAMRRWLGANGFTALYAYTSSSITDGVNAQKLLTRKKFIREFTDSAAYRELLGSCYGTTCQSIIDSGVIIEMISAVHVGNFERIPEFDECQEKEIVNFRVETIAQEILRFVSYIAHS